MAPPRTEPDETNFPGAVRLSAQERHCTGNVTHNLIIGNTASGPHPRANVVRASRTVPKIEMGSDGRIAVVGKLAGHLDDPFVPARHVVNDDYAWEFAFSGRSSIVRLSAITVVADEGYGFSEDRAIRHGFSRV
jgi:hypothetical protein